jgi:6-O-methylguanine DNA methyltransferase, DNA binding domain
VARKSTWTEKLHRANDLPKVVEVSGRMARSQGEGSCVIPAPIEVDHLMRQVQRGRVITSHELRQALATFHETDLACPLTTGIFCWIASHAAAEAEERGERRTTPWWRTLKSGGELNPKFPGGLERQRALLESEGHTIRARGKRLFVAGYESQVAKLEPTTLAGCLAKVTESTPTGRNA